jgi:hypothetical protein
MRGDRQPATHFAIRLFLGVARLATLTWLAPALLYNVDWSGHDWRANTVAVFMILGSALFIECALRLPWELKPLCIVGALLCVYVNTKQAMRVVSLTNEVQSEAKAARVAGDLAGGRMGSQLQKRRDEQAKVAGETSVGALKAQLQAFQLSNVRAWNATDACSDVTSKASGAFCARVAEAKAKIEAAKERDKLDAQLAALPAPKVLAGAEVPVVDPYVANVVALLNELGFRPSERLVKAEEAMARALLFEVMAALGPTCWLALVNILAAGGATASARVRKAAAKPDAEKVPAATTTQSLPGNADELDRCIADEFELEPAGVMSPKEIRPIVKAWCAPRGVKYDSKLEARLWPTMGQRFKRDATNNRPRYFGLKPRVKGPPRLAVVASA